MKKNTKVEKDAKYEITLKLNDKEQVVSGDTILDALNKLEVTSPFVTEGILILKSGNQSLDYLLPIRKLNMFAYHESIFRAVLADNLAVLLGNG